MSATPTERLAKSRTQLQNHRNKKVTVSRYLPSVSEGSSELVNAYSYLSSDYLSTVTNLKSLAQLVEKVTLITSKNTKFKGTHKIKRKVVVQCNLYKATDVISTLEAIFQVKLGTTNLAGNIKSVAIAISSMAYHTEMKEITPLEVTESMLVRQSLIYASTLEAVSIEDKDFNLSNAQLTMKSLHGIPPFDYGYWETYFMDDGVSPDLIETKTKGVLSKLNKVSNTKNVHWFNYTDIIIYCAAFYYWVEQSRANKSIEDLPLSLPSQLSKKFVSSILKDEGESCPVVIRVAREQKAAEILIPKLEGSIHDLDELETLMNTGLKCDEFIARVLPAVYNLPEHKVKISGRTLDNIYKSQGLKGRHTTRVFSASDLAFVLSNYARFAIHISKLGAEFLSEYSRKISIQILSNQEK